MGERSGFKFLDLDDPDDELVAYSLDEGEVADDELKPLWQRFDEATSAGTKLRVYAEMNALPTFGPGMAVDKLKRFETLMSTIERMAIVGDESWLPVYARTIDSVSEASIRHFPTADKDAARAWIRR